MSVPASVISAATLFLSSVQAAAPLNRASSLTITALLRAGYSLLTQIDDALAAAADSLDSGDPTGFPGDLVNDLLGLTTAAKDQSVLADMRGRAGRAIFNLSQAASAPLIVPPLPPRPLISIPPIPSINPAASLGFEIDFATISVLPPQLVFARADAGTYWDSSGVLRTAALNVPRLFDHDPFTLARKGILIEGPDQNLIPNSSNLLDAATWVLNDAGTFTASATGAPDGSGFWTLGTAHASAVRTYAGDIYTRSACSNPAGATATLSWHVKKTNWRYVALQISNGVDNWVAAIFDLDTGLCTEHETGTVSGTFIRAGSQKLADGTYRLYLVGNIAPTGIFPQMSLSGAASGNLYDEFGDPLAPSWAGTESYLSWGPMLSPGDGLTSYIPSTGTPSSRSGDIIQFNGSAFNLLNGAAGTAIVETSDAGQHGGTLIDTDPTAINQDSYIYFGDHGGLIKAGSWSNFSTPQEVVAGNALDPSAPVRVGVAWDRTGRSLASNGGDVALTLVPFGTFNSPVYLGSQRSTAFISGHVNKVALYSARLDNATLQAKSVVGAAF